MIPNEIFEAFAEAIAVKVALKLRQDRPAKKLLTVKETATYVGRSVGAVHQMSSRGEFAPMVKTGRRVHYSTADLDRWIEENKI